MKNKTLVDERILDGIPDELIRPLLAISIRATRPNTIDDYKQLLKDIRKLVRSCSEAGGSSLYYIDVENAVEQRLAALLAAQKWARKTDTAAEAKHIGVNRWYVNIHSGNGDYRGLLVAYERAGLDRRRMEEKVRFVVTEASERDV